MLHLSWIFILIGAFITRYISYEGVMSIREGETESAFLSEKTYLDIYIDGDFQIDGQTMRKAYNDLAVDFSPRMNNKFYLSTEYGGAPISIKLTEFINGAEEDIVFDENGELSIPSIVGCTNISTYVGIEAKNQKEINTNNVFYETKRLR